MSRLRSATDPAWIETVLADFDAFLIDHAACERKAAATGMAFVVRYPDRPHLLEPVIAFAREELEHFHQVYRVIARRGLQLRPDERDPYVSTLSGHIRSGRQECLLDRLLLAGVVEARGAERFGLVADALPTGELKDFYLALTQSEARHHGLFIRLARETFDVREVEDRLDTWLELEAEVLRKLPLRAALH